jgi:hypothetical protein
MLFSLISFQLISKEVEPWKSNKYKSIQSCYLAAEKGVIEAQIELGESLTDGIGIDINYIKAIYWLKKAAQAGNHRALTKVALAYGDGKGVKQNVKMVFLYSELAVKLGGDFIPMGLKSISMPELSGRDVQRAQLFSTYWKPGDSLPKEDFFDAYFPPASSVSVQATPRGLQQEQASRIEYHIVNQLPSNTLGFRPFVSEGSNGWEIVALVEHTMPMALEGMPTYVDAIFKRNVYDANPGVYTKWEYKVVETTLFSTRDHMLGLNDGWEIATVFLSKLRIPPVSTSSFVIVLKRKIN